MIDKAAVMGAVAFAASYAEAQALAADAGIEITPEEYDEATKEDKKAEYAGYLTNFFGGQKDGGRIGYARGTPGDNTMFEELNVDTIYRPEPESTITLPEELPGDDKMAGSQGYDEQYNAFIELRDTFHYREGDSYSEANRKAKQIVYGMKDGGRIGFEGGANELIMEKLKEDIMPDTSTEDMIMIMTETGPKMIKRSDYESMSGMFRDTTTSLYGDAARGRPVPEFANGGRIGFKKGSDPVYEMYLEDLEAGIIPSDKSYNEYLDDIEDDPDYDYSYAKGGRVSRKLGSKPEDESEVGIMSIDVEAGDDDEGEEDMMMAYEPGSFTSAQKSYMFRRLAAMGGKDRSITMPDLYKIFKNPGKYPADELVIKSILDANGLKDGGRIGLKDGTGCNKRYRFFIRRTR